MSKFKIVLMAVIGLLTLIVVLQNTQAVETKLLFLTVTMPGAALLFGALLIGFGLGVVATGRLVGKPGSARPV
jgi:uncharacterized integral membrane protein